MTAVFTSNGLGLFGSSADLLGQAGLLGGATPGQSGEQVYVNALNGNLVVQRLDEILVGQGVDASLARAYNSQGGMSDSNGDDWVLSISRFLTFSGTINTVGSTVTRHGPDGSQTVFEYDSASGEYVSTDGAGAHNAIRYDSANSAWIWEADGGAYSDVYDASGALQGMVDRDGNQTVYSYDGSDRLTGITLLDPSGSQDQVITFGYGTGVEAGLIKTVTVVSDGVTTNLVSYDYDASQRLSVVTVDLTPEVTVDSNIYTTTYTYEGSSTRISTLTQSDGTSLTFDYIFQDGVYKVEWIENAANERTSFFYNQSDVNGTYTEIEGPTGATSKVYTDGDGQLRRLEGPADNGQRTVLTYDHDADGNLTAITDGAGNQTTFTYDARGNRLSSQDSLGNRTEWTYTSADLVATETAFTIPDPDGNGPIVAQGELTTRWIYDAEGHVTHIIDAAGDVTRFTYDAVGNQTSRQSFADAAYDTSGLAKNAVPSASTVDNWILTIDRSHSELTEYGYDFRGQLETVTSWEQLNSSGAGVLGTESITRYVYDHTGKLVKQISARGELTVEEDFVTVFGYDGLNRITSRTAAEGQSVTTTYADSGSGTTVSATTSAGLLTVSSYDVSGRLVSVAQSGASDDYGTAEFFYTDGLLRAALSTAGARSYSFYDDANRLQYSVDETGAVTETIYDALGRVDQRISYTDSADTTTWWDGVNSEVAISTTQFEATFKPAANALDRTINLSYDDSGRLVAENDGVLETSYTYDGLSRLTLQSSQALDGTGATRESRIFYDEAGRQIATLDAEGALVESRYDAAGRLVQQIAHANEVAAGDRTSALATILAGLAPHADDQSVHYYYDDRGQLAGMVDGERYLTSYEYDEDGNRTSATRYANELGPVALATDIRPSVTLSPDDQTSTFDYDQSGRLLQTTNHRGDIQAYAYDDNDNVVRIDRYSTTPAGELRRQFMRYDAAGRLTGEVSPEQAKALNELSSQAAIDAAIATNGIERKYDVAGRLVQLTDQVGNDVWFYYDDRGQLRYSINALGEVQESEYNSFGEVSRQTSYANRVSVTGLTGGSASDVESLVTAVADPSADRITRFEFNARGLLARQISRALDAQSAIHELETDFDYTVWGQLDTVTADTTFDGTRRTVHSYTYDLMGRELTATAAVGPDSRTQTVEYDAFGRVVSQFDELNRETRLEYDRNGRLIDVYDPLNRNRHTTYDAFGRTVSVLDELQRETTFDFDDATRTVTMTLPGNIVTVSRQNEFGETVEVIDAEQVSTVFDYDQNGNLLTTTVNVDGQDQTVVSDYDAANRLTHVTDAAGRVVEYRYDAVNRLFQQITDPDGIALTTEFEYNAFGQQVLITDAGNRVIEIRHDLQGRVIEQIVDPGTGGANLVTRFEHDARGRQVAVTTAAGTDASVRTEYVYNDFGQLETKAVDPETGGLGLTTSYEYDDVGNMVKRTDAAGAVTHYVYDSIDRLQYTLEEVGNGKGYVTETVYDELDRVVATHRYADEFDLPAAGADPVINVTGSDRESLWNVYDDAGRIAFNINEEDYVTGYVYDDNGRLITNNRYNHKASSPATATASTLQTEINNATPAVAQTTIEYDELGRERFLTEADSSVKEFRYDASGNLIESVLPGGVASTRYFYDAAGRKRYELDAAGNLVRLTQDGSGNLVLRQVFDAATAGNLAAATTAESVDSEIATLLANENGKPAALRNEFLVYDSANRLRYSVDGLGQVTWQDYDEAGRVIETRRFAGSLATVTVATDVTDLDLLLASEDYRSTKFAYDDDNRLRFTIDSLNRVIEQVFDDAGNMVEQIRYRDAYQLSDFSESGLDSHYALVTATATRVTGFEYDALGRTTSMTNALLQTERYEYDAYGNRTAFINKADNRWEYKYDGVGNLVEEMTPQETFYRTDISDPDNATVTPIVGYQITSMEYDYRGNVKKLIEGVIRRDSLPDDVTQRYETSFGYDALGRQTSISYVVGEGAGTSVSVTTRYDALGNAVANEDVRGNVSYKVYDSLGRQRFDIDAEGYITENRYDAFGNLVELVRYANRQAGLLGTVNTVHTLAELEDLVATAAVASGANRTLTHEYDAAGQRTRTVAGAVDAYDGTTGAAYMSAPETLYSYNAFGELSQERRLVSDADSTPVWADTYRFYNAAGQLTAEVNAGGYLTTTEHNGYGETFKVTEYARALADTSGVAAADENADFSIALAPALSTGTGADASIGADRVREYEYDALGRVTGEFMLDVTYSTYANGMFATGLNAARLLLQGTEYDAVGNVSRVTDSAGNSLRTGFNTLGHAIWTKEVARDVMLSTQAGDNGLAYNSALENVANQTRSPLTTYQYDVFGNVLVEHDWANGATGSATSSSASADDRVTYYRYDNARRKVEELDAEGNSTLYAYDAAGNITSESRDYYGARGATDIRYTAETRYVYDALGQQITTEVLLGSANQMAHAAVGNQVIEVAYNAFGEVVNRGTSRSSYEETFVYDDAGRLIEAPNQYGEATTYSYDLLGNLTRETSATTGESVYHYDALGRGTRVDRPIVLQNYDDTAGVYTGGTTILEYDRWDNVVSQTERSVRWADLAAAPTAAYQNRWEFNYNKFDQVTKEVQPETNIVGEDGQEAEGIPEVHRYYDALGRQVAETDTRSNSRYRVYNNANQVIEEIDALGNATKYAYDVFGRQVAKQNALGYITTTDYDRLDQAVLIGDLRYDSANTQSYNQQLIAHTYNALGHQVSTTYSQSVDVDGLQTATSYSDYDVRGNLVRSESATGLVVLYAYDSQGRRTLQRNGLWSAADPNEDQLSWAYDYFGRVQSYNNLGGVEYGFAYDATTGLLAFKGTTAQLAQYEADPNNLSGGISYEYYDNGALKRFQDWNDGITAEYEYDHAGRRTYEFVDGIDSRNDLYKQVTRTEYDEHGRVYRVVTTDLLQAGGLDTMDAIYGYDEAGNRRYVKVSSRYSASYTPPNNTAPTATAASTTPATVMELDTVRHSLGSDLFTDPDGDTLSYFAEIVPYDYINAGWGVIRVPIGPPEPLPSWVSLDVVRGATHEFYLDVTAPPLTASEVTDYSASGQAGEYAIRLHARDQYGAEAIRTFTITVLDWVQPNDPPTVGTPIPTVTRSEGQPINFTIPASAFNDPDGHTLRYSADYVWTRREQTGVDWEGIPIFEWVEHVDPLPSWLTFNENTGTFGGSRTGISVDESITIRVQAHETDTQQLYSSGTQDFTLTIEADNEAPYVDNPPASSYAAIPGQLFTRVMSASTFVDPNGDPIAFSASGMPAWLDFNETTRTFTGTPSASDAGSTTITLTGTDPEGLSVSTTFAIIVNSPPQLDSAIGDRSPQATRTFSYNLAAHFSDADGDTLTFTAAEQILEYDREIDETWTYYVPLPSWMSISSAGVLTGTPPTAEIGSTYTIRIIASDGTATRTTFFDLSVTAFSNLPPTAGSGSFANQTVAEGGSRTYTFPSNVFSDPDGQPLTYTATVGGVATTSLSWANITSSSRTLTFNPGYSQAGTYTVAVTARDTYGATYTRTFTLTVNNTNRAPTVANPIPNRSGVAGASWSYVIPSNTFSDPDGTSLSLSITSKPSWMSWNSGTRTLSGTPPSAGSYSVTVRASDGSLTVSDTFTLTVTANNAPVLNSPPASSYDANVGSYFNLDLPSNVFTDPNGDAITYSASGMPSWMSFTPSTVRFTGTPNVAGVYTITLRATDPYGASSSTTFTLDVNTPPQLSSTIGNRSPQASRAFSYNIGSHFSDADGDTLTFSADQRIQFYEPELQEWITFYSSIPSWMSFSSGGVLTGTPPASAVGDTFTIRVTASDGQRTVTSMFDVNVLAYVNTPPTAGSGSLSNQSVAEGGSRTYTFPSNAFTDPDGHALTYTAKVGGVATTSLSWANLSGRTLTFNPGYSQAGTYTVAITARDTYGATYTRSFTLTVTNTNRAPTVANPIPNRSGVAGAAWSYVIPSNTFSDPDGNSLSYSITSKPSWMSWNSGTRTLSGTPPSAGSYNVTVRASDGSLTVSDTFTLTVTANSAPVLNSPPASSYSANVGSYFNLDLPSNVFTDPNGDAITYSASGMPSWMSFTPSTVRFTGTPNVGGVYTITLRATDPYGASSSTTFTLDVNTPPQLSSTIGTRSPQASRAFSYNIGTHFSDADGDSLTFSADQRIQFYEPELREWITFYSSIPSWMSFSSGGVLTGTPPASAVGDTFTIRVTASDGQRTVTSMFNVNVVAYVNTAPTAGSGSLTNQSVAEGGSRTYTFPSNAFTDPDGHALTYTARVGGVATTSLSWANLSGRTLTFNPGYSQAGTYTVAITARDTYGATYTRSFTLTVTNTNRAPTVANPIPNQTASVGVAWSYTIPSNTFSDPDGNSLSYSITSKPSWMSWNASTRRLSGTPPSATTWNVTVRASDGSRTVSDTFSVTATAVPVNQAPEFSQNSYFRVFSSGDYIYINFGNLATDPDGDTLTYSASGMPAGLSLNSSTGVLNGNVYLSRDRSFTVTVSDGSLSDTIFVELIYMGGGGGFPHSVNPHQNGKASGSTILSESSKVGLNGSAASRTISTTVAQPEESADSEAQVVEPIATGSVVNDPAPITQNQTQNVGQGAFFGPYDWAWDIDYIDEWYTINATPYVTVNQKEYWYTYDAENRIKIAEGVLDTATNTIGIDNTQGHILDYDAAGNQIMRTTSLGSVMRAEAFRYNALGQLVSSQKSDGTFSNATGLDETARLALYNDSSQWQTVSSYQYDLAGRIKKQVDFFVQGDYREVRVEGDDSFDLQTISVAGNVKSATHTYYDDDGRVTKVENMGLRDGHFRSLLVWIVGGNQPLSRESDLEVVSQVVYDAGDYDAAGNVKGYRYQKILNVDEGSDPVRDPYTIHYNYTYEKRDSYQVDIISGSGTGTHQKDSTSNSNYDSAGRLISVYESYDIADYTEQQHRYFRYNGDSQIIFKVGGTYDSGVFTPEPDGSSTRHFYFTGGNQIGSVDGSGRIFFEDQAAYQIAKTGSASNAQTYTARDGDTLRSVARAVYGSETLWYVIADANGMSDDTERLRDGQSLRIPAFNSAVNDADSFKAFNAEEVIGDRTPAVPYVPPPPSADKGCGIIGQIIMIVVAVVVTVYTAGAAASAMAGLAGSGTSTFGAGLAALSGGTAAGVTVGTSAALTGAFVGGFAGSVASQLVGKALGVVDSFSLKSALASGLTSAASSALSGMEFFQKANLAKTSAEARFGIRVARGAATYLSSQAAQIIVGGERSSFSWASVAAAGLGSAVGGAFGDKVGPAVSGAFGKDAGEFASRLTSGIAAASVSKALGVGGKVELQAIAVDAFANTVGNAIVDHYDGKAQDELEYKREEQAKEDAKKVAEAVAGQASTMSDAVQDVMAKETLETTRVADNALAQRTTQQAESIQENSSGIGNNSDEIRARAETEASQTADANALVDERIKELGPFEESSSDLDSSFVSPSVLARMEAVFNEMLLERLLENSLAATAGTNVDIEDPNLLDRFASFMRANQASFNESLNSNAARMISDSIENPGIYSYGGAGYVDSTGSAVFGAWLLGGLYEFTADTTEFFAHPINNTVGALSAVGSFMGDAYLSSPYGYGMYGVSVYAPHLYSDPVMQEISLAAQGRLNARFDAGLLAFDGWLNDVEYSFQTGDYAGLGALTFEQTVGTISLGSSLALGTVRLSGKLDSIDVADASLERMLQGEFVPADFDLSSIASDSQLHSIWTDSLRRAATNPQGNAYQDLLNILEQGGSPTRIELRNAFGTVNGYFGRSVIREGLDIPDGPIHHWNFNLNEFPDQAFDPRNLFPTNDLFQHNTIHMNVGSGNGIDWFGPTLPRSQLNIDSSYYPLPSNYFDND